MIKDPLGDEVARAYSVTTAEQRQTVAEAFRATSHKGLQYIYASLLQINPDALLVASLLEVEHESICNPNGRPKAKEYGILFKLALAHKTVDNSPKTVDNSPKTVDRLWTE